MGTIRSYLWKRFKNGLHNYLLKYLWYRKYLKLKDIWWWKKYKIEIKINAIKNRSIKWIKKYFTWPWYYFKKLIKYLIYLLCFLIFLVYLFKSLYFFNIIDEIYLQICIKIPKIWQIIEIIYEKFIKNPIIFFILHLTYISLMFYHIFITKKYFIIVRFFLAVLTFIIDIILYWIKFYIYIMNKAARKNPYKTAGKVLLIFLISLYWNLSKFQNEQIGFFVAFLIYVFLGEEWELAYLQKIEKILRIIADGKVLQTLGELISLFMLQLYIIIYVLIGLLIYIIFLKDNHKIINKLHNLVLIHLGLFILAINILLNFRIKNKGSSFYNIIIYKIDFITIYDWSWSIYIDILAWTLIVLTMYLITIILIISLYTIKYQLKWYIFLFLLLEFFLILFFISGSIWGFYLFFEAVLIPMLLIIFIWGSRKRKIYATYLFFFYTVTGSLIMLLGILQLYLETGTSSICLYKYNITNFSEDFEFWIFLLFFIAMGVKVPMFPVHTWLPEAHVEAPTGGSMILAGILLKLGIYGILRLIIPNFKLGLEFYTSTILTFNFISVIYISIILLIQTDLKKIIAYSSIAHMNLVIAGIISHNIYGLVGGIYTMLSHGLISGLLFFCVGILYDRYGERNILYYSNITQLMPLYSSIFFFALLANMGIPGTSAFIGEFLLLIGFSQISFFILFIMSISLFITTVYCIWLYNRIFFGYMKITYIKKYKDVTKLEFTISLIFIILILFFGIYPSSILDLFKYVYV